MSMSDHMGREINVPDAAVVEEGELAPLLEAFGIYKGAGVPVVAAPLGSIYLRTDPTTGTEGLYVRASVTGTPTWVAK